MGAREALRGGEGNTQPGGGRRRCWDGKQGFVEYKDNVETAVCVAESPYRIHDIYQ